MLSDLNKYTSILANLLKEYPLQHLRSACPNVDPNQYDARSGNSTIHPLLKILQPVDEAIDDSKISAAACRL